MKVPHEYSAGINYATNPQPSRNLSAPASAFGGNVAQELQRFGAQLQAQEAQKEEFDINRLMIEEDNQLTTDFAQRQQEAPLGASGFTQEVGAAYEDRHAGFLNRLKEQGFSDAALRKADERLAVMRNGKLRQSMAFQEQSYGVKAEKDVNDMALGLSQGVMADPNQIDAAVGTMNSSIDSLPMDAMQKARLKDSTKQQLVVSAAGGLAQNNPEEVVKLLSGGTQAAPASGGRVRELQGRTAGTRRKPLASDLRSTLEAAAAETGLTVEVTSGGQARKGTPGPRTGSTRHDDGHAGDLQLRDGNHILNFNNDADRPKIQAFIKASIKNGATGIGAGDDYMGSTRLHVGYGPNGAKGGPVTIWGAGGDVKNAPGWLQETVSGQTAGTPPRTSASVNPRLLAAGKTGNPVLDSLTGPQRLAVLGQAQATINRRQVELRAPLEQNVENASMAYLTTGTYQGQEPTQGDFYRAYDAPIAEQKWAAFQNTKEVGQNVKLMATMPESEILATIAALKPTPEDTASPTFAEDQKAFNQASTAAQALITARTEDPMTYARMQFPNVAQAWQDAPGSQAAYSATIEAYKKLGIPEADWKAMPTDAVSRLKRQFEMMPPKDQLDNLLSWKQTMGELYPTALRQIATDGMPVPALLATVVNENPASRGMATQVLQGMQIIEKDKSRKPDYELINAAYRTSIGDAYKLMSPTMAQSVNEAATALYVAQGGDPKAVSSEAYKKAMRQVLGGDANNTDTGIVDISPTTFGGSKTILPPGVTGTEFTNFIDELSVGEMLNYSVGHQLPKYANDTVAQPQDIVNGGTFIQVNPGVYTIQMKDGGFLYGSDGEPYMMKLNSKAVKGP